MSKQDPKYRKIFNRPWPEDEKDHEAFQKENMVIVCNVYDLVFQPVEENWGLVYSLVFYESIDSEKYILKTPTHPQVYIVEQSEVTLSCSGLMLSITQGGYRSFARAEYSVCWYAGSIWRRI